jgi:hypothetical protein
MFFHEFEVLRSGIAFVTYVGMSVNAKYKLIFLYVPGVGF